MAAHPAAAGATGRQVIRLLPGAAGLALAVAGGLRAEPYPSMFESAAPFREAIAIAARDQGARAPLGNLRVTGVTVPHHLLAADLIAETLQCAAGQRYERILLLSPDHFRRSPTLGATTTRPFRTPLGDVPVDAEGAFRLCDAPGTAEPLVSLSNLFSHEHGVQAVLPFLAHWFPGVPVLPVTLDVRSGPADWERLARRIEPLVTPRTLIVQSTDFSHYLTQPAAAEKDQETLRLLATGDAGGIADLDQPAHLDSKAAQWVQMSLQRRVFGCGIPIVLNNRNAIRYGGRPGEPKTTSYITQLYTPDPVLAAALPGEAWFFGGDTHFGRGVAEAFDDPQRARAMIEPVLRVTGGRPLVLNLEGVVLDEPPGGYQHPLRIGMGKELSLRILQELHAVAVSLANNHSLDFGAEARKRMIAILRERKIAVAEAGAPVDLGPFRLAAASDLANRPVPAKDLLDEASFRAWRQPPGAGKPLFAFFHCGVEYRSEPGARERQLAAWAENAGASLILGAHPHRPSPGWERSARSLRFFSLGNLIFDQLAPANGGGLVEVRFFEQGTWTARWHPLGNLYPATR